MCLTAGPGYVLPYRWLLSSDVRILVIFALVPVGESFGDLQDDLGVQVRDSSLLVRLLECLFEGSEGRNQGLAYLGCEVQLINNFILDQA